jgi:hypothetical protein
VAGAARQGHLPASPRVRLGERQVQPGEVVAWLSVDKQAGKQLVKIAPRSATSNY